MRGYPRAVYRNREKLEEYMANIIAVIWDFDKTLVNGYMQDPIFKHYQVDSAAFWHTVNSLPQKYKEEQNVRVNKVSFGKLNAA